MAETRLIGDIIDGVSSSAGALITTSVVMSLSNEANVLAGTWGSPSSVRITVPTTGVYNIYLIAFCTALGASADSVIQARIRRVSDSAILAGEGVGNNSPNRATRHIYRGATTNNGFINTHPFMAFGINLTAGDVLDPQLSNNQVGMLYGIGGEPIFYIQRVG